MNLPSIFNKKQAETLFFAVKLQKCKKNHQFPFGKLVINPSCFIYDFMRIFYASAPSSSEP